MNVEASTANKIVYHRLTETAFINSFIFFYHALINNKLFALNMNLYLQCGTVKLCLKKITTNSMMN